MEELNEIKKQFDELMAKAEEIVKRNGKKSEDGRWRAGYVEEYYYIVGNDFEVYSDSDDYAPRDDMLYEAGNYFQTEEEAKKVAQHCKDYLILRADAKGFELEDVSSEDDYYYVFWSSINECLEAYNGGGEFLCVIDDACDCSGVIYFKTKKDAEASIEKHGDIWKRYLGVEE